MDVTIRKFQNCITTVTVTVLAPLLLFSTTSTAYLTFNFDWLNGAAYRDSYMSKFFYDHPLWWLLFLKSSAVFKDYF